MSDFEERDLWESWITPEKRRRRKKEEEEDGVRDEMLEWKEKKKKKKKKCVQVKVSTNKKKEDRVRDEMLEWKEKKKEAAAVSGACLFFTQQKASQKKKKKKCVKVSTNKKKEKKEDRVSDEMFEWKEKKKKKCVQVKVSTKTNKKKEKKEDRVRDEVLEWKEKKQEAAAVSGASLFFTQQKASQKKKKKKCVQVKVSTNKKKEKKEDRVRDEMLEWKEKKQEAAAVSGASLFFTQQKASQKKKKKVAFDLSAGHVPVKRPGVVSSSPGSSRGQTEVSDEDDFNSQDLFITQKTFRPELHSPEGLDQSLTRSSAPLDVTCPSKWTPSLGHASTQTENFFTDRLCSYLHFCQSRDAQATPLHQATPLDLSLPTRTRNHLDQRPVKEAEQEAESSGDQRKDKVALTSESEVKSVDTTASSEDGTGKLDLTQVRSVQTRLNESFFFKAKGDEHTQRPESPLMKLSLGRDRKSGRRSLRSGEGH